MSENFGLQRYGRNKSTLVNSIYISSGEYRNKFHKITDNEEINGIIYSKAKEMLWHRSGTLYEDMYWFDADTGEVLAKEIHSDVEEQILYSESIHRAIEGRDNIIAVHTHPCSMPPSIADFNAAKDHKYMLGVVLCHNGKIFCYKSGEVISKRMDNLYVADYYVQLHDKYLARLEALKELSGIYDIEFWEA